MTYNDAALVLSYVGEMKDNDQEEAISALKNCIKIPQLF